MAEKSKAVLLRFLHSIVARFVLVSTKIKRGNCVVYGIPVFETESKMFLDSSCWREECRESRMRTVRTSNGSQEWSETILHTTCVGKSKYNITPASKEHCSRMIFKNTQNDDVWSSPTIASHLN